MPLSTRLVALRTRVMRAIMPKSIVATVAIAAELSHYDRLGPFAEKPLPTVDDVRLWPRLAALFEISPDGWRQLMDQVPRKSSLPFVATAADINKQLWLGFDFYEFPLIETPFLERPRQESIIVSATRFEDWRRAAGQPALMSHSVQPNAPAFDLPLRYRGEGQPEEPWPMLPVAWPLKKGERVVEDTKGRRTK